MTARGALVAAVAAALLSGCATLPPPPGLVEMLERAPERALYEGLRSYDEGRYEQAEAALRQSLALGIGHPRDRATAHKLLAFIQCTSERIEQCEAAFRAAREADPGFALGRAEAGHPVWGPVYQRVAR